MHKQAFILNNLLHCGKLLLKYCVDVNIDTYNFLRTQGLWEGSWELSGACQMDTKIGKIKKYQKFVINT